MKRKLIATALACVLVCASCFGITYAYLIAKDNAANTFTVGETEIEVSEEYTPPEKLTPGISFTKKPRITNTGNLPCYVRMRADFSSSIAKEFCEPLDIDTENWEYNSEDGYYYYKYLLNPGEETFPLFTTVTIKTFKDDEKTELYTEADMTDFDILIYGEAAQHKNHEGACEANEYQTVWTDYFNERTE